LKVYKHSLLLFASLGTLYANFHDYSLVEKSDVSSTYFVKLGAFKYLDNALKLCDNTPFVSQVEKLQTYYSVLSEGVDTKEEALEYLKAIRKNYSGAYIITLYQDKKDSEVSPVDEYQQAITLYQNKDYEEALAAFDRILIVDENHVGAAFYYAKTLYRLGLFSESKKAFHRLSAKKLTQKQKFERAVYFKALKAKEKTHTFNGAFSIGLGYDDNINLTTADEFTQYGPITLINNREKSDSVFGLASLTLRHRYETNSFAIVSRFYSYHEFLHSEDGNDLNYFDFSTGVLKKYQNFSLFMPIGFNSSYLEGENIGYNFYTNPTLSYHINKQLKTFTQVSFLDNRTRYIDGKDYQMFGGNVGMNYHAKRYATGVRIGLQTYDAASNVRFDVDKDVMTLASFARYFLTSKRYLAANVAWQNSRYNLQDDVMGYKREDDDYRLGFSFSQGLGDNAQLNLSYQYRNNRSNINAYSYEKNILSAAYKYKF